MRRLYGKLKKSLKYLYHKSMRAHGSPRQIALGMGLGVFAGMLPYAISQTVVALILAAIFRANKVSAALGTWVTNPFTNLPLYFIGYSMGALLLGHPLLPYDELHRGFEEAGSFMEVAKIFVSKLGMPIFLGTTVFGVICGIAAYFVTYQAVVAYRLQKNLKRMRRLHKWQFTDEHGWHRAEKRENAE